MFFGAQYNQGDMLHSCYYTTFCSSASLGHGGMLGLMQWFCRCSSLTALWLACSVSLHWGHTDTDVSGRNAVAESLRSAGEVRAWRRRRGQQATMMMTAVIQMYMLVWAVGESVAKKPKLFCCDATSVRFVWTVVFFSFFFNCNRQVKNSMCFADPQLNKKDKNSPKVETFLQNETV